MVKTHLFHVASCDIPSCGRVFTSRTYIMTTLEPSETQGVVRRIKAEARRQGWTISLRVCLCAWHTRQGYDKETLNRMEPDKEKADGKRGVFVYRPTLPHKFIPSRTACECAGCIFPQSHPIHTP